MEEKWILNLTDQLDGYAGEVEKTIKMFATDGFSTDQAIKIVELAIKDMMVDVFHHMACHMVKRTDVTSSLVAELLDRIDISRILC